MSQYRTANVNKVTIAKAKVAGAKFDYTVHRNGLQLGTATKGKKGVDFTVQADGFLLRLNDQFFRTMADLKAALAI